MKTMTFGQIFMGSQAHLGKRFWISALHKLYSDTLSPEENQRIFGKCCNVHGHDYGIDVIVEGKIDAISGLCCNRDLLEQRVDELIIQKFNKSDLNLFFKSTTGEDLAREFYGILKKGLPEFHLVRVGIQETPRNYFSFPAA